MNVIKTFPGTARNVSTEITIHATQLSGVSPMSFEGGTVPAIGSAQAVHDRLVGLIGRKGSVAARDANKIMQINDAIVEEERKAAESMRLRRPNLEDFYR